MQDFLAANLRDAAKATDKHFEHRMRRLLYLCGLTAWLAGVPVATAQQVSGTVPNTPTPMAESRGVPPPARVPAHFLSTVRGTALNAMNVHLAGATVRLRDARFGRVVAKEVTDSSGLFEFGSLDPGSYVVELVSPDETAVMAASEILNVDAGEVASTVVKLPFRMPLLSGALRGSATPSAAAAVVAEAAAAGVLIAVAPPIAAPTCQTQVF